jgi:DNA polymerase
MLLEMGVRVWQPQAPMAEMPVATKTIAVNADAASANGQFGKNSQEKKAFSTPAAPPATAAPAVRREAAPVRPASPPGVAAAPPPSPPSAGQPAPWRLGEAQPLYADSARPGGARWLVLAQATAAALHAPAFDGDAGRLLNNMLRAARLHQGAGAVLWAPLVRQAAEGPTDEFSAALAALIARERPDVVLVMGRLAVQALLHTSEPLGRLRGRVHALHGARAVVTCDAAYLLRTPADKARAWDDLCLAISVAASYNTAP